MNIKQQWERKEKVIKVRNIKEVYPMHWECHLGCWQKR